jgi:hypothetical protein
MIKIDKKVAIPHVMSGSKTPRVYPFPDMKIGDSFLIKGEDTKRIQHNIASSYFVFTKSKQLTWRFTTRIVEGGVRCWRIG